MRTNNKEQINFLSNQFEEWNGYDFYKYIFPDNENKGEMNIDYSKPNSIYLYEDERDIGTKRRLRRRVMLNDTWEDDYRTYVEENDNTLCSGLSYRGKANKIDKAQEMNALIIDLDGVGEKELKNLFLRFDKPSDWIRTLPMPTFIVSSGKGVHIYYVFQEPIDLFPNIKLQLKAFKYELTFKLWEYKATSQNKAIQYQSINQGFRMVGSINNKYGVVVRAFKTGGKVTLEYINQYVDNNKVDIKKPFRPSKMTLEEARTSYPEWYERVIINKNKQPKKWDIKSKQGYALYNWWLRQIKGIRGGHRYFFLMCMSIYAAKCDVPKSKLKEDMAIMFEELKKIQHENAMSEYDMESALEAYDKAYYNFTIADIEKLTDVRIERNKRNYRNQSQHLKFARGIKILKKQMGESMEEGRPVGSGTKEELVKEYIKKHPEKNVSQIAKELGISRPTVYKYKK